MERSTPEPASSPAASIIGCQISISEIRGCHRAQEIVKAEPEIRARLNVSAWHAGRDGGGDERWQRGV